MFSAQPLDILPVWLFVVLFLVAALVAYEIGYRVGAWWQRRHEKESEGPTGVIVGSVLALMAFLLAITTGMAGDRFDTRRGLILAEANSIGTTALRAGYLPEPASSELHDILRDYARLRITGDDTAEIEAQVARSEELHADMWAIAEELAREQPESDVLAIFIESLNETIDLHTSRVAAGAYARVPVSVLWLLVGGVILSLGMVGYSAGLALRRSMISAVVLVVAMSAVMALVIDLDRPIGGLIRSNQQPLIDVAESLEASR